MCRVSTFPLKSCYFSVLSQGFGEGFNPFEDGGAELQPVIEIAPAGMHAIIYF